MANGNSVTNVKIKRIDVIWKTIVYIEPQTDGGAWIHFVGGRLSEGRNFALAVKETPDAIRPAA